MEDSSTCHILLHMGMLRVLHSCTQFVSTLVSSSAQEHRVDCIQTPLGFIKLILLEVSTVEAKHAR